MQIQVAIQKQTNKNASLQGGTKSVIPELTTKLCSKKNCRVTNGSYLGNWGFPVHIHVSFYKNEVIKEVTQTKELGRLRHPGSAGAHP